MEIIKITFVNCEIRWPYNWTSCKWKTDRKKWLSQKAKVYELKNIGNGKYVSKCNIFVLILNFFKTFRVVVLGWWEDKTLDHFPFQYLTKSTMNTQYLLDIIPLPHQILPSPCSWYLEADLYGSHQKAPLPSRF